MRRALALTDGRWEVGDRRWEMGGGRWEMGDGTKHMPRIARLGGMESSHSI